MTVLWVLIVQILILRNTELNGTFSSLKNQGLDMK